MTSGSRRDRSTRPIVGHARRASRIGPHHYGDKAGLLTAVAARGYEELAAALDDARETTRSFLEVGVAYVRFAVAHRALFEVMYRPELYRSTDPDVQQAKGRTAVLLYGTDHVDADQLAAGVAAWSLVHGVATLWLNGNLPERLGDDPEKITRIIAAHLRIPRR